MAARPAIVFFILLLPCSPHFAAHSQTVVRPSGWKVLGEPFPDFVARVTSMNNVDGRVRAVRTLVKEVETYGRLLREDSSVVFIYSGPAGRVMVPGDLNGWQPNEDVMTRIEGTDFFYLVKRVDPAARFEYKLMVDSLWILDPLNHQTALGGYGPNSEVRMPAYQPSRDVEYRESISHGKLDTLEFTSPLLGQTHPVFVYLPAGYTPTASPLPTVFVADGGEYLSLGLMNNVLDNLIADGRIPPTIGVFVDPRTDLRDSRTSKRMTEYALSDAFVAFLTEELRPDLLRRYRIATAPQQCAMLGASLGGLISTYAAFRRPDVFGLCAAQSPAYQFMEDSIFTVIGMGDRKPIRIYVDTGTIRDAEVGARRMKNLLASKGYTVRYQEFPEAHNWVNWRARLADILMYFWGTP